MRVQVPRTSGRDPAVRAAGKRAGGSSDGTDDEATIRGRFPRVCPGRTGCGAQLHGAVGGIGTLGLRRCSSPAVGACTRRGLPEDRPEPGREAGREARCSHGSKQPLRHRPESEHLSARRPHDAGAGETRPGSAPSGPACEPQIPSEEFKSRSLHVGQVRGPGTACGRPPLWPHPGSRLPLAGRGL